jgi:hypothetical protein
VEGNPEGPGLIWDKLEKKYQNKINIMDGSCCCSLVMRAWWRSVVILEANVQLEISVEIFCFEHFCTTQDQRQEQQTMGKSRVSRGILLVNNLPQLQNLIKVSAHMHGDRR